MSRLLKIPVISQLPRRFTSASDENQPQRAKCTLIPGDGVGPELMIGIKEVFQAGQVPIDFEPVFFSEINPTMSASVDTVAKSIKKNGVCLKGIVAEPDYFRSGELQNLNMKLKQALDLFAHVVHIKALPGVKTRHENVDLIIVREQTEGEYSALEHESVKGMVECLKIITEKKSLKIAKFAFDYATKLNRKKVTCVHKANIMKLGDGLFMRSCENMAKLYPKIRFEKMIVDNCTMQMVSKPHQFDVLVAPNLYGSILGNLGTGLVGGAGMVPSVSYSARCAVFEQGAAHIFSGAVGKNVANPIAMLISSVKMLRHVNLGHHADMIKNAVEQVLREAKVRTRDIGGHSTTQQFVYAVIKNLQFPSK